MVLYIAYGENMVLVPSQNLAYSILRNCSQKSNGLYQLWEIEFLKVLRVTLVGNFKGFNGSGLGFRKIIEFWYNSEERISFNKFHCDKG